MRHAELITIMPVFNEADCISAVITEWLHALSRERIKHCLIAINDGSTDATFSILQNLQSQFPEELIVLNKSNSGHGQTCRFGYEFALEQGAQWILQIDSDGQCDSSFFSQFMAKRSRADCVFGVRIERDDGVMRRLISELSRLLIAVVAGQNLRDPNVPYRLIKSDTLGKALSRIPKEFDLQNVAMAVVLKRSRDVRWAFVPIRFRAPSHPQGRMTFVRILRMGLRMLMQMRTIKC
jgi:glycosyltransferase involved in cell wall biosynthesis